MLLSVCSESRQQALRVYELAFATTLSEARIYFNPVVDVLHFERYRDMGYDESVRDFKSLVVRERSASDGSGSSGREESEIWERVRYIALDYVDVNIKRPWESYNKACLIRSFPNLEEINLVITPTRRIAPVVQWLELTPEKAGSRRGQELSFASPKISPEMLLRWWAGFRHSFAMEERMFENAAARSGKPYDTFSLPAIKLVAKC